MILILGLFALIAAVAWFCYASELRPTEE